MTDTTTTQPQGTPVDLNRVVDVLTQHIAQVEKKAAMLTVAYQDAVDERDELRKTVAAQAAHLAKLGTSGDLDDPRGSDDAVTS